MFRVGFSGVSEAGGLEGLEGLRIGGLPTFCSPKPSIWMSDGFRIPAFDFVKVVNCVIVAFVCLPSVR